MTMKHYLSPLTFFCLTLLLAANSSANDFVNNKNGTVTDTSNSLIWQAEDDNTPRDWQAAQEYCQNMVLGGHDDWRVPNHYNLRSIGRESSTYPSIDLNIFPQTKAAEYWSSTYLPYYDKMAYFVNFGKIDTSKNKGQRLQDMEMENNYYVRCVRGKRTETNKKQPSQKNNSSK